MGQVYDAICVIESYIYWVYCYSQQSVGQLPTALSQHLMVVLSRGILREVCPPLSLPPSHLSLPLSFLCNNAWQQMKHSGNQVRSGSLPFGDQHCILLKCCEMDSCLHCSINCYSGEWHCTFSLCVLLLQRWYVCLKVVRSLLVSYTNIFWMVYRWGSST